VNILFAASSSLTGQKPAPPVMRLAFLYGPVFERSRGIQWRCAAVLSDIELHRSARFGNEDARLISSNGVHFFA